MNISRHWSKNGNPGGEPVKKSPFCSLTLVLQSQIYRRPAARLEMKSTSA
jgi:hypothetical protein